MNIMAGKYDEAAVTKYFDLSAKMVTSLKKTPTNDEKLSLYGLYKQSTCGNCNTLEPNKLFSPVENAKWQAWKACYGKTKLIAMDSYSQLVTKLIDKYGV